MNRRWITAATVLAVAAVAAGVLYLALSVLPLLSIILNLTEIFTHG